MVVYVCALINPLNRRLDNKIHIKDRHDEIKFHWLKKTFHYEGKCSLVSLFFHICTVRPAIINFFYYQLMHKRIIFKPVLKLQ